jgi:hypothetical protein
MKIRPVAAELFHETDGRSDKHDEANIFFPRNFANAPKNVLLLSRIELYEQKYWRRMSSA